MRVAVFGAGYAGLTLARQLQGTLPDGTDLVVVDERDAHLVQHELHRVVRRPGLADEITLPLADVLDCEVRRARVTDLDADAGRATVVPAHGEVAETLSYDVGAVCLGAVTDDHGVPGVDEHATPLKRLEHAQEIRRDFLDAPEGGRVVVAGAGLSGVQVAGELTALADEEGLDREVHLLERLGSVAPGFDDRFQAAVADELRERGVEVRTGAAVEAVDEDAVQLADGTAVDADQVIWTGGIRGPDALDGERPTVRSDLRLGRSTFAVGDAVRVVDVDGTAVPASAQAAVREARTAAANVRRLVETRRDGAAFDPELARYAFDSPGWLVSVGDGAVAQVGSRVLTGRAALALKTSVGAGYLGSVGAVENAVDLVRSELGLDAEES